MQQISRLKLSIELKSTDLHGGIDTKAAKIAGIAATVAISNKYVRLRIIQKKIMI